MAKNSQYNFVFLYTQKEYRTIRIINETTNPKINNIYEQIKFFKKYITTEFNNEI